MASTVRRSRGSSMLRTVNSIFGGATSTRELTRFGITPIGRDDRGNWMRKYKKRQESDAEDATSEEPLPWSNEGDRGMYLQYEEPVLDADGNPVLRKDGTPKVRRMWRKANEEELAMAAGEAAKLMQQEEDRLAREAEEIKRKQEEEARAARLEEQRAANLKLYADVAGGETAGAAGAGRMARRVGYAPTLAQLHEMENTMGPVDYDTLVDYMQKELGKEEVQAAGTLTSLFKYYDSSNSGTVSVLQFRNILCSFGEPMSQEEVDALLQACGQGGKDRIDYSAIVDMLMSED